MTRRRARKAFVSEWMLEFSVLWAVFPLLDQLLTGQIHFWILGLACGFVIASFVVGFCLVEGDES